ncbi:MAG: DUF4239 domain-containing protein [Caulobacteraceae bacterium]
MSIFLSSLPLWLSFLLVVIIPTIVFTSGLVVVRRLFSLERLTTNNEVAGFKFAVVGVTYAVLLGFAVIVVWEKFRDAEAAVAQEASAVIALDRLSRGMTPPAGAAVREQVINYVQVTLADDWPAMAKAEMSRTPARALNGVYDAVMADAPTTPRGAAIMAEMLYRLDSLTEARRTRLLLATGVVPGVLWSVLFAGAFVTLTFTFFFGLKSLGTQIIMTGMLATLIFMALYVAIEIDHPFTGPVSVGPEALRYALENINQPD